jgi:hypothetical protein
MNLRERVIPLNITEQGSNCCWDWCSPLMVTIFLWGKGSRYSRNGKCTCVGYLSYFRRYTREINKINVYTREINWILISWIHLRNNYPFQLDYCFHERGKSFLI